MGGDFNLESRSNHSLTRHNSRENRNNQARVEHARWHRAEERVGVGARILADVCSLTDVLDTTQR